MVMNTVRFDENS